MITEVDTTHYTLLSDMCYDTEIASLLTPLGYLSSPLVTEAGSLLSALSYQTYQWQWIPLLDTWHLP